VLEKLESWFSQHVAACKTKVVASRGIGAPKNDNVKNIKITYHIKKKRFFPLWVSSGNICPCIFHVCDCC
jgi:hypothetical protein